MTAGLDNLGWHGDRQVPSGAVDLAVNVEAGPPDWLADDLAARVRDLAGYPDDSPARAALAARHGRTEAECLPVNGAAEAFRLIADRLSPRLAACVHPSFTEPEIALRAAGVPVVRVMRSEYADWVLHPERVPDAADLVVLGRPDNPTGALEPIEVVERLARPGRILVVDEAFAEFLDDAGGLAGRADIPGLVCVRSLTKLWGLAGLRVGYVVGPASVTARLDAGRQPWSCNSLALAAIVEVAGREAERRRRAADVAVRRTALVDRLVGVPGIRVWGSPANFVLIRGPVAGLRDRLLDQGLAVRAAGNFPGLDDRYVRIAVRDAATSTRICRAVRSAVVDLARR